MDLEYNYIQGFVCREVQMAVKIVTDSTSYIPKHIAEKYGIEVLSLSVFMSEEIRRELDCSS